MLPHAPIASLELAKLAVTNLNDLLECDRQMVLPINFQPLPSLYETLVWAVFQMDI